MSDSLQPHGPQHARPPCPSPIPRVYSNSCPSSQWRHPTISSSVIPFSSCPQSFPALGSFPMSQLLASGGGQSIGVSASTSVLAMNRLSNSWTIKISLILSLSLFQRHCFFNSLSQDINSQSGFFKILFQQYIKVLCDERCFIGKND